MLKNIEKNKIPIMENFYTIQGEGYHQGKAAYFIRIGGCDIGCHWCDVKESWPLDKFPIMPIKQIVEEAKKHPARLAVITGGEPLLYNLDDFTIQLKNENFKTHIETSGAYPLSGSWDWICLSPKKFKIPKNEILPLANELKIIIYNKSDFLWAEEYAEKVSSTCQLFLQPEWSRSKQIIPLIINYVKENPKWKISLQIHKYLNVP